MVGLLLAAYSMLIASVWFSTLKFGSRLSVLGENPIWIARVGVLGTIACLFLFATWRVRLLAALPLLVMVIATGWRGPMLSLLAGGLAYLVLKSAATSAAFDRIRPPGYRDTSPGTDLGYGSDFRRPGTTRGPSRFDLMFGRLPLMCG